jgi:F0F1-type ATP synthase gamma subunit
LFDCILVRLYASYLLIFSSLNSLPDVEDLKGSTTLIIPITSDRGLCGSLNTVVVRETRKQLEEIQAKGGSTVLCIVGDKGVAQLQRY